MKLLTLIFGLILCIAIANCRHHSERIEKDESTDDSDHITKARDFVASQMRHRRKRWQNNYGYDYPPPPPPPYYSDRREYDRNNQDLYPQILRLLDEIATYVKRPPPPPQPIYIPYPVPYPVPQMCACTPQNGTLTPFVNNRFKPTYEDANQNWGLVESNPENEYDDSGDGSRPISFDPIIPKRPMRRPMPKVEHGSTQGKNDLQTQASITAEGSTPSARAASMCNIAILSCCNGQKHEQKTCFTKHGCGMTFAKGNACSSESISSALESFRAAYAPVY